MSPVLVAFKWEVASACSHSAHGWFAKLFGYFGIHGQCLTNVIRYMVWNSGPFGARRINLFVFDVGWWPPGAMIIDSMIEYLCITSRGSHGKAHLGDSVLKIIYKQPVIHWHYAELRKQPLHQRLFYLIWTYYIIGSYWFLLFVLLVSSECVAL